MPIYEEFEKETEFLMQKYTQQESTIQNLQSQNQELIDQINALNVEGSERMELMSESQSAATEMMMASDGTMSMNSDMRFKTSGAQLTVRKLQTVSEQDSEENSRPSGSADLVPSMQDLIEEAKAEGPESSNKNLRQRPTS